MTKPDFCGMKHQTLTLFAGAIELVTNNGAAQTVRMGTMDAQLVGSTGLRPQGYKTVRQEFVVGNGTLAMFGVYKLPRTIHRVWAQG
jgi:hypothetical protein